MQAHCQRLWGTSVSRLAVVEYCNGFRHLQSLKSCDVVELDESKTFDMTK